MSEAVTAYAYRVGRAAYILDPALLSVTLLVASSVCSECSSPCPSSRTERDKLMCPGPAAPANESKLLFACAALIVLQLWITEGVPA